MKKMLSLFAAAAVLTSVSCSSVKPTDTPDDTPTPTESALANDTDAIKDKLLLKTNCYQKEDITLPDTIEHISWAQKLTDGTIMICASSSKYKTSAFYKTDDNFAEFTPFEYDLPDEYYAVDRPYSSPYFNADGTFVAIMDLYDHGGMTLPEQADDSFDYDTYYANEVHTQMICTYDKSGKLLTKAEIEYPEEFYGTDDLYISSAIADGNSLIVCEECGSEYPIFRIDADGKLTTLWKPEADPESPVPYQSRVLLFKDRDFKPICIRDSFQKQILPDGTESMGVDTFNNYYDLADGKPVGDPIFSIDETGMTYPFIFGTDEYRFYVSTNEAVTGVKDDGSTETVIDWAASNLDPMMVIPIADNNFIGCTWNNSNGKSIVKLTPKEMSDLENVQIITVANGDQPLINEFNNSQTKYRVESIRYDDKKQLDMDVISGKAPDVLCTLNHSTLLNYQNKGVFADLYELMDDELNKDDLMPNVLTALENNGKLNMLCTEYTVQTVITKTSVNNKESWTFDEMCAAYDRHADTFEHIYDNQTNMEAFKMLFYTMNDLIDYEKATCHFDSPEFIKMLEFCSRFPTELVDVPTKFDDPEAYHLYLSDKNHWLGNNKIIAERLDLYGASTINLQKYIFCNGEDLTLAGYPSNNGKGGRLKPWSIVAINAASNNKQGAWEYVKFLIKNSNSNIPPDPDDEYFHYEFFPILKNTFDLDMKYELTAKHSVQSTEYPPLTQADVDMLTKYILSCDSIGTVLDDDICKICEEEAGAYFAGGQTSQVTAEHIQNRVSILVSERS